MVHAEASIRLFLRKDRFFRQGNNSPLLGYWVGLSESVSRFRSRSELRCHKQRKCHRWARQRDMGRGVRVGAVEVAAEQSP